MMKQNAYASAIAQLQLEKNRIEQAIAALTSLSGVGAVAQAAREGIKRRPPLSAARKAELSKKLKKFWAEKKKAKKT